MYFVDRNQIERILSNMEDKLAFYDTHKNWQSPLELLALERLTHILVESFLDVGNQMIDGFIMRDPGSYEDIVDILVDESVVSKENEEGIKRIVNLRKQLVRDYVELNHEELRNDLAHFIKDWQAFPEQVRSYLEKELGPVSAFMPDERESSF